MDQIGRIADVAQEVELRVRSAEQLFVQRERRERQRHDNENVRLHKDRIFMRSKKFRERRCCKQRLNRSEINFNCADNPCRDCADDDKCRNHFGARA